MIVSVEKAIPETKITLSYMVGSTELFSDPFTIEVFDCAQMIKLPEVPEVQTFQVGQILKPINASFEYASNDTAQDCPIEAYQIIGSQNGAAINKTNGTIIVDTSKAIEKSYKQLSVVVGSQILTTPKFSFEVVDCIEALQFSSEFMIQVDQFSQNLRILTNNTRPQFCNVSSYVQNKNISAVGVGSKNGTLWVDSRKPFEKTELEVLITVGTQKVNKTFEIQVHDCTDEIEFINDISFQIGSGIKIVDPIKSNPDKSKKQCGGKYLVLTGLSADDQILSYDNRGEKWIALEADGGKPSNLTVNSTEPSPIITEDEKYEWRSEGNLTKVITLSRDGLI